jgi:hypothetical protein
MPNYPHAYAVMPNCPFAYSVAFSNHTDEAALHDAGSSYLAV